MKEPFSWIQLIAMFAITVLPSVLSQQSQPQSGAG